MTAPTLPAMTPEQITAICNRVQAECDSAWPYKHFVSELVRAFVVERDAQWTARVAELQAEIGNLCSVMIAAAEEIHEHWSAHCDEECYGPANLMRRLEKGIPGQYAYRAGDFERLTQERDAAVARLDAAVRDEREACAVFCDGAVTRYYDGNFPEAAGACMHVGSAIRASTKD